MHKQLQGKLIYRCVITLFCIVIPSWMYGATTRRVREFSGRSLVESLLTIFNCLLRSTCKACATILCSGIHVCACGTMCMIMPGAYQTNFSLARGACTSHRTVCILCPATWGLITRIRTHIHAMHVENSRSCTINLCFVEVVIDPVCLM